MKPIMSKKQLKARWSDAEFLNKNKELIASVGQNSSALEQADLAGAVIGYVPKEPELFAHVWLNHARITRCDLRFAKITTSMNGAVIEDTDFMEAKFNQAGLMNTKILHCNFTKAHIIADFSDAAFDSCTFAGARISGGSAWAGHGGVRSVFSDCDFTGTTFIALVFRATRFYRCDFTNARFIGTDIRGMKVENCLGIETILFERMDIVENNFLKDEHNNVSPSR